MNTSKLLVVLLLLSLSVSVAGETKPIVFKVATIAPDGTTWMTELKEAARKVRVDTEERVKFKYYPGGVMGDDQAVIRKMRAGQLQGGIVLTSVFAKRVPSVEVFTQPLHFESYAEVDLVRAAMDHIVRQDLEEAGYVCLGLSEIGFAYAMSKQPLTSVKDAQRLKVWAPKGDQLAANVLASFGVTPIPLSPIDVLTGLQTGLIDTITSPASSAIALQWHSQIKYVLDLPLLYLYGVYVVNKKQFDRLSELDRKVVRKNMGMAADNAGKQTRLDNTVSMEVILERGAKLLKPTEKEIAEWTATAMAAKKELLDIGQLNSDLYARLDEETERARQKLGK